MEDLDEVMDGRVRGLSWRKSEVFFLVLKKFVWRVDIVFRPHMRVLFESKKSDSVGKKSKEKLIRVIIWEVFL